MYITALVLVFLFVTFVLLLLSETCSDRRRLAIRNKEGAAHVAPRVECDDDEDVHRVVSIRGVHLKELHAMLVCVRDFKLVVKRATAPFTHDIIIYKPTFATGTLTYVILVHGRGHLNKRERDPALTIADLP